jgi:hypothetical protein
MEGKMDKTTCNSSQLAEARATLVSYGKSPRQIGNESRQSVIDWIYKWGYSSSANIQNLLGRTAGGYAQKLTRQGWLVATKTESGSPVHFFTLSQSGLQEAEHQATHLYHYPEIDPFKVNQQLLRHNLLAQKITANALLSGAIKKYETDRMFGEGGDKSRVKKPDVVWTTNNCLRIGVEIELSAKWARFLDDFVVNISSGLKMGKGQHAQYDRFLIVSDSPAIIERYQQAMQPETQVNIWTKNQRHHWVVEKCITF